MRPYQWPKSVFIFAALVFSAGDAWTADDTGSWWPLLWRTLLLFGAWSLAASGTYLINDVLDRERDRLHPVKRLRPIASGQVTVPMAIGTAIVLTAVAVPVALALDLVAGAILAGYVTTMTLYSLGLKSVAIVDMLILTGGVVGRAVAGATAIDVEISPWLYVCSAFAAFFYSVSKRWAEFRLLGDDAADHRPSLAGYTNELLTQMLVISASTALLAFALYTIEAENVPRNGAMAITLPFVAFGMFRYLMLLGGAKRGTAPEQVLFRDPQILGAVTGFVATALVVLLAN